MTDPKMRGRSRVPESLAARLADALNAGNNAAHGTRPDEANAADIMRFLAADPAVELANRQAMEAAAAEELNRAAQLQALEMMARGPAPGDPADDVHAQMTRAVAESAAAQDAVAATHAATRRRMVKPGAPAAAPVTEPARLLQAETDLLSKDYEEAAVAIAALRLGVSGEVEITRQSDPGDVEELIWSLRFCKEGKEWVLKIIKTTNSTDDWIEHEMDVARAPRWIRKRVVDKLPALIKQLHKNVEDELDDVRATRTQVAAFTASLKTGAT